MTIPSTVTSILPWAFWYCRSLESISLPNGVILIENDVFRSCSSLESIIFPGSVKSIGSNAFDGCISLKYVTIPESVTSIGDSAFKTCSSLVYLTINSNSILSISKNIFPYSILEEVTLGDKIVNIPGDLFKGFSNLTAINVDSINAFYSSIDGVLFNKERNELIRFPEGKGWEYFIPLEVEYIMKEGFKSCYNLISVKIPSSVVYIGDNSFNVCVV